MSDFVPHRAACVARLPIPCLRPVELITHVVDIYTTQMHNMSNTGLRTSARGVGRDVVLVDARNGCCRTCRLGELDEEESYSVWTMAVE